MGSNGLGRTKNGRSVFLKVKEMLYGGERYIGIIVNTFKIGLKSNFLQLQFDLPDQGFTVFFGDLKDYQDAAFLFGLDSGLSPAAPMARLIEKLGPEVSPEKFGYKVFIHVEGFTIIGVYLFD